MQQREQDASTARVAVLAEENRQLRRRLERAIRTWRTQQEELASAARAVDWWKTHCERATANADWERTARQAAQQEATQLRLQHMEASLEKLNLLREIWPLQAQRRSAPQGPPLETVLRGLLTVAHLDRWAQGQPATELAHELTVTINALRERGQA